MVLVPDPVQRGLVRQRLRRFQRAGKALAFASPTGVSMARTAG